MRNADLMQSKKYLVDIKNYSSIGKPRKKDFSEFNIVEEKETGKKYASKTSLIQAEVLNTKLIMNELAILIQIQHPTIMKLRGFYFQDLQGDNTVTILTKYMENGSITDFLDRKMTLINQIDYDTKRQIILVGIAYGLMILQDHNIMHYNFKPENILLDDDYQPRITDFFLSKFFKDKFTSNRDNIAYVAPEVIITNNFNSKSNVYSFGILMYEILTGTRAYSEIFQSKTFSIFSFQKKVIEGLRPKFDVPVKKCLKKLIKKCWSSDPNARPSFAEIFKKLSLNKTTKYDHNLSETILKDEDDNDNDKYCLDGVNCDELSEYVDKITSSLTEGVTKRKKNEKEKLLQTEELCQKILSLDKNSIIMPQSLPEESKQLAYLLMKSFPSDSEIRSILKDLKTCSFNDSIKHYIVPIEDCNYNFEMMINEKDLFKCQGIFEAYSFYTFYSLISIHLFISRGHKFDIIKFLSILNNIVQLSFNDSEKSKIYYIAISCFFDVIKISIEKNAISNFNSIFKEISDLFTKNGIMPIHSNEIIKYLSDKFFASKNENKETIGLISLIIFILDQNPKTLTQQLILSTIKSTKTFIINLNSIYLNFFLNAAKYIEIEDFINIFKPLFIQVLTNVALTHDYDDKMNQITNNNNENDENNSNQLLISEYLTSDYFSPPSDLYQINSIDDSMIINEFKVQKLTSFIDQQIFQIILIIKQMILLNDKFAKYFLSEAAYDLQSLDSSFNLPDTKNEENKLLLLKRIFYEQCAIVFYLVSSAIKKFSNLTVKNENGSNFNIFNNKYIFDPKVTYFNQNSNFDIINSLRHFAFQFFIDYFPSSLNEFLNENSVYSEIFLESVCRIISLMKEKQNSSFEFKLSFLSDTLISYLIKYRISKINSNNNNLILTNRKAVLLYFNDFLMNDSILQLSFCSPTFMNSFLALLIEPPIRHQFIHFLNRYLALVELNDQDDSIIPNLFHNIIKLFEVSCNNLQLNEGSSLLLDILNSFNEAIITNKSLTCIFTLISSEICHDINNFKLENNDELFMALISFLANTFYDTTIKVNELILLESTFIYFIQTKSQIQIMEKLIQIIAGEQLQSISPTFIINNTNILCSFVRIFLKTNLIFRVIKFISDLCSYSSLNCIKCHEGELDLLLINRINKWRKDVTIVNVESIDENETFIKEENDQYFVSGKLIDLVLHLFCQIASSVSSASVVQSFFSMLCPINSKYLSPIYENILKTLNNILIQSKFSPISTLSMSPSNEFQVHNIPMTTFDTGLSFVFWISMPSKIENYSQKIITLKDEQKHKFKIKMIEKSLRVNIQSGTIFYSSDFQLDIPIKTWTMVTISLVPNPNNQGTSISLYINKEQIKNVLTFTLFSPKTSVECVINHSKQISINDDFDPPLMGIFLLSKQLTKEDISSIYEEGQRSLLTTFSNKIIFAYKVQNNEEYFSIQPIQKLEGIIESQPKIIPSKMKVSFSDFLINYSKIDLILPIFGELDIPLKNNNKLEFLDNFSIEILSNLFLLGEQAQTSFYKLNGFFAIAHLLENSDKSRFKFELYLSYYKLLETITYKNLQLQLIDAILMNFNLWSNCETINQAKIFKHWEQSLYDSYKNLINSIRKINWFLLIIHKFYNSEIQFNSQCRKSLFDIANESYKSKFSSKYLSLIIGFIVSNKISLIERKEMLNFLSKIIHNKKVIIDARINVTQIILNLFQIFSLQEKDDDLILQTISLFIIIYKHKEYNIKNPLSNLIQEIIITLHIKQNYCFKEDMFSVLISLMNVNKAVELLPLISINIIYGGPSYLIKLLKNIDRKLDYYVSKQTIMYPALLIFAFYSNTYLYHEVIRMNVSLFKHHWTILINSINILGTSCFNQNVFDKVKHDVLIKLINQPKITLMDALSMIRVIKDFIFFRPEKAHSSILTCMFNQDPFNDNNKNVNKNNSKSNHLIDNDINDMDDSDTIIPISNSDSELNFMSNSLPYQNTYGYKITKIQTLPNTFHMKIQPRVRFDLNAVGPVLGTNNKSESTFSDDLPFNFEFEYNGSYECDPKIIEIISNLNEIIENMIKPEIPDSTSIFKYKFGMRFDQNTEKWLDLDLAKYTFVLYKSYKDIQYIGTMKLLAHFIYKCDRNFVNKMKAYFPDLGCYLGVIKKIAFYDSLEQQLIFHDDMINHQNLLFSDAFVTFYNSCLNDSILINKNYSNKNNSILIEMIQKFENNLTKTKFDNKMIWSKLWHSLTITRAPWSDSISNISEEGFQRSNRFCYAYCPIKIERIKQFDKHIKASLSRDISDKKKVERILSTIVEKEQQQSKIPLFIDSGNEYKNKTSNDKIIIKSDNKDALECKIVTIKWEKNALIKFDSKCIIITITFENKTIVIPYSNIYSILYAYKHQKYKGLQIFTKYRKSYFVIFQNNLFRTLILRVHYMQIIDSTKVQNENPKSFLASLKLTDRWLEGKITNFEYLICLNILSGRSFNDSSQYPIFPWILSDYESKTLNLNKSSTFRDLSKPMGAINQKRLNELLEKWNKIKEKETNSYLYENCYSNLFIVYYYLIRLEPFTTQQIELNSGKFDDSSLVFKSIKEAYQNATSSHNDFRELIPEFFYFPDFLKNINKFDLGKNEEDHEVNDVVLPPWANNSPIEFIYLHRKALESDFVSSHLNEWIDLIWGFKQDGDEAVKAHNVFRPEFYETIWKRTDINEKGIKAVQSNAGQIPLKLFETKHPERKARIRTFVHKSSIPVFSHTKSLSLNSFKDNINEINNQFHYLVIKFFEISSSVSAHISLTESKNKFNFSILDNNGCIFLYSIQLKMFKSSRFALRAKSVHNIVNDKKNKKNKNNSSIELNNVKNESILFPRFIDSKKLCFYDKETSTIKIVNCKKNLVIENVKQNFDAISIETNSEGFLAVSSKDATVTVFDVNSFQHQNSKVSTSTNSIESLEIKSHFENSQNDNDFVNFGVISSLRENVICMTMSPSFNSLICGTRDNCLLFCRLDLSKMKVDKLIKVKGRPQKVVVTDGFGFVAVSLTKIKNGDLIEKLVLYSINGVKIKSLKFDNNKRIVALTKAMSSPGGFDFLIVADSCNCIYVFEAFNMKLGEPIFKCNTKIIKIKYLREESLLIVCCEDGTASVIYYPIIS